MILAIALDEDAAAIRQWAVDEPQSPITYPVLIDRDFIFAEAYGITNVPSTVWIDESGDVARPPAIAPGDDTFKDFTKIDSSIHHHALRAWVRDEVAPMSSQEMEARIVPSSEDLQRARAERRLAMHLLRAGHDEPAFNHLATAMRLAPEDWTIHRGSMPARGEDPFGQAFFDFYQAWEEAGRPGYEP